MSSEKRKFLSVPNWYFSMSSFTWPTYCVKLRPEAIDLLREDGNTEKKIYTDVSKQVIADLALPMGNISGNSFVFVDTCAPTDTERFDAKGGAVYSPRSAWRCLLQSRKVQEAAKNDEVTYVCLRPFRNICEAREFRLFIKDGKLSAMSQYRLIRHFHRLEKIKSELWDKAERFVKENAWRLPESTLVMDLYFSSDLDIYVIDLNPWGECDPLLLNTWERDWDTCAGLKLMAPPTAISGNVTVSF